MQRAISRRALTSQGNILKVLHRHVVEGVVVVLHSDHVVVAGFRVDPVAGCNHAVRGERGDDVVHDFLLRQPHHAGSFPVDIQGQTRVIQILRNINFIDVCDLTDLVLQIAGDRHRPFHVVRADLHIDRRGEPLVDHAVHQPAGEEIGS